jgi:hypothetical protein
MSTLAFDKEGKPFGWSRSTRQLRVRVFKNPSARGTCCQVLDGEGNPLYVDAEADYMTFRKLVGPPPACTASINVTRTASKSTTRSPRTSRSISRATPRSAVATAAIQTQRS